MAARKKHTIEITAWESNSPDYDLDAGYLLQLDGKQIDLYCYPETMDTWLKDLLEKLGVTNVEFINNINN